MVVLVVYKAGPLVLNCYSSCGMWTDETDQQSGVRRCLAVGMLRNGEGTRRPPANLKLQLPILLPIWVRKRALLRAAHPG